MTRVPPMIPPQASGWVIPKWSFQLQCHNFNRYLIFCKHLSLFGVKKHFNITSFIIFDQSSSGDPTSSFRLGDFQVKSECLGKWTLYKSVTHSFFLSYWSLLIPSVLDILHHSHHHSPSPAQDILSNQYPHSRYNLSQIIVIAVCERAFNWKTVNDDTKTA